MGSMIKKDWDEEYSVVGDKGEVGFLDFEDDKSINSFSPLEEGPVMISIPFPFIDGKPQSAFIGETSADSISIRNTINEPIDLWSIRIFCSNPEDSYVLSLMKPPCAYANESESNAFVGTDALEDRVLQPRQNLTIWLSCKPKEIGLHTSVVHFDVGFEKIERVVFLLADDQVSQALFSKKPYSRGPRRRKMFELDNYVVGSRPSRGIMQSSKFRLPRYPIPKEIREMVEAKHIPDVVMEGLNRLNYSSYFSTLISMEEIHLEEEMRAYDMECVTMRRRNSHILSLEVPGLAERRPSLVYGDSILAKLTTDDPDSKFLPYQGYIHGVEADEILLNFDRNMHLCHRDDNLYNVSFTYNRFNMRRLYHAVEAAERLGSAVLFPSQTLEKRVIITTPFQPLNPSLNREQIHSIEMILGCKGFPPYVIHGPPGTGKTMTLVEAILQLYTTRRKARILVCASSNSAADYVLEKLLTKEGVGIRETEIFRLNASCRPYYDVRKELTRFCYFDNETFKCPPFKALLRYRVIISTYTSAYLLHAEGINKGHFSHIFLDEAGQASEPETMVPISTLCVEDTVVVLAGDPMQLGPVVYSKEAERWGLGKSYMERLFEFDCYEGGDENYVTKLLRNYRSHPAILELPSKIFYRGELIACKDDDDCSIYDGANLPNKIFPLLLLEFKDVMRGKDDIGVITPYRQQVLKLQKALETLEIPNIKVGSVEQFQGQERKVIIISTVRSTVKHNKFDRVYNLGFLTNSRRLNVAITRARSLLIIVGNPHIITKDPYWNMLLRYCADNGSYQGCPLPPESQPSPDQSSMHFVEHRFNTPGPDRTDFGEANYSKEVERGVEAWLSHNSNDEYYEHSNQLIQAFEASEDAPEQYPREAECVLENECGEGRVEGVSEELPGEAECREDDPGDGGGGSTWNDASLGRLGDQQMEWKGITFTATGWDD
ncbi:hypothetical protein HPP92_005860 [Vanilla planifolia]|uniref:RNA helicase n=1 Tax=Vanilla planifolia TaxID=51239 RepID=A0A835RUF7_VANPL|nr:hypothetical protein HPP92_005860 [Vanilla planifolia]